MDQLNAISDFNYFTKITDACLDQITGRLPSENLTEILASLNLRLQDYISILDELKNVLKKLVLLSEYEKDDLPQIDNLEKRIYILDSLKNRKPDIVHVLLDDHNSSRSNLLYNYDWKVKMILGTSSDNNLKYPVLQMDTTLLKREDEKMTYKNISFELCKNKLDQLINVLEKSQNSEIDF